QPEAIAARIQPGKTSPSQAAAVLRQLDAYTAAFGDTKSAISAAPTSDALRDALEAARKGAPAPVATAAPEAKLDDFGRRVVEAREHKGEILRCSADGRGGTLSYLEALKRLKRNMILQLEAGAYPDDPILTPGVYLEFEPNVVGNITVSAARCVVRKATQAIVHFKPAAPGDELLAVDSEISIECHRGGAASLFNCIVNVHWISGDTKIYFRHCTFVFRPAEFAISTAGDSTSIRLDDCVAWCDRGAAFGIGKPHPGTVFVECRRCLLPGRMGVLADNTASGSTSMGTPVPASSFKLVDCVQKDEDAVKTFVRGRIATVLGFHSGARGLAAGGRDPGAWLDEDATIRPLDPAIPAAKSNSGRRPGTAPRTPSGESPAVR
ncbi:MAG: hypothetical protein KJ579_04775, partial [Verrucomicrobia bacterium]|nr:hypothetical protein [Verrucomicrobiota bacterium]